MTMLSPLQLDEHRFRSYSVEAIASGLPNYPCQVTTEVSYGHAQEDELSWKVELKVTFGPSEDHKQSPYSGQAVIVGFFKVAEAWPAKKRKQLVAVNGSSVLYSAVREMVLTTTGRCTHGLFTLPTISFVGSDKGRESVSKRAPIKKVKKNEV